MAESSDSRAPQSLSIGDVVSTGFRLYQSRSKDYLRLASLGTLWALAPYVGAIALTITFVLVRNYYALLGLLIPALIVFAFFCLAQFQAYAAAIARLTFGELSDQPETVETALRFTRSRKWSFVWAGALLSLIYMAVLLPFYLLLGILVAAAIVSVGGLRRGAGGIDPTTLNPGNVLLIATAFLLVVVLFLGVVLWLVARLFAYELPLAVETEMTASQTIGRIWKLTKGSAWRIVMVLVVTLLVTIPLQILTSLLSSQFDRAIETVAPVNSSIYMVLSSLVGAVIGLVVSILMLPLWQSIKSAVYYDLRNRREGFGLQLRDRPPSLE